MEKILNIDLISLDDLDGFFEVDPRNNLCNY